MFACLSNMFGIFLWNKRGLSPTDYINKKKVEQTERNKRNKQKEKKEEG
jgi:hypothetical protein